MKRVICTGGILLLALLLNACSATVVHREPHQSHVVLPDSHHQRTTVIYHQDATSSNDKERPHLKASGHGHGQSNKHHHVEGSTQKHQPKNLKPPQRHATKTKHKKQTKETVLVRFQIPKVQKRDRSGRSDFHELKLRADESCSLKVTGGGRQEVLRLSFENNVLTISDPKGKGKKMRFRKKSSWKRGETYLVNHPPHNNGVSLKMTVRLI